MKSQKIVKKPAAKTVVKKSRQEPKLAKIRILTATGKNRREKSLKATKKPRPASRVPRR